jgi:mRNA interferase YafQ
MNRLKKVMLLLIENSEPLPPQYLDHALTGEWANHRECHIGGDFLLIYKLEKSNADERIIFIRAGSHAELFE